MSTYRTLRLLLLALPLATTARSLSAPSLSVPGEDSKGTEETPKGWYRKLADFQLDTDYHWDSTWAWEEYGFCLAGFLTGEGESEAIDIAPLRGSLVSVTASGWLWDCWRYEPFDDEEGEVEAMFRISLDHGALWLQDGPCAAVVGLLVSFEHDIGAGADKKIGVNFSRSTGTRILGQVSWFGVLLNFAVSMGEGLYNIPDAPDEIDFADHCQDMYTYSHRSAVYMETLADGWHAGLVFNHARVRSNVKGTMVSHHGRGTCPE